MNLMFWKKKTGAEEEAAQEFAARNSRDSLDFIEGEAETAVPDETEGSPEPVVRKGSWLGGLLRRFRKAPAFRAESTPAGEASEASDEAPPDMEAPARPGWTARIKLQLAAALQGLRKTPAPAAAEEEGEEEKTGARSRSEAESFEDAAWEAAEGARPVRSKKRLVIAAVILLVLLLAAGAGVALLPLLEPQETRWGTKHDITSISSRPPKSDTAPGEPQNELDELRRENAALQARIEALRKEAPAQQIPAAPPRQVYVPPAHQGGESAAAPAAAGDLTIGTSDPRAAAMTLKEAIETMNAASEERPRKPGR